MSNTRTRSMSFYKKWLHGNVMRWAQARAYSNGLASGQSLYQVLGLQKDCTAEDIKKAYRKYALLYHPDKNPNNPAATAKFQEVNQANSVLSDDLKRNIYDRYGSIGIYVAEQFGEENVNTYFVLTSPWCKALFLFCGIVTGCYLCCCCCCFCNFCCGLCKPRPAEDSMRYANLRDELGNLDLSPDHDQPPGQPIVIQPSSVSAGAMATDQAGERTAFAGANVPSTHRTEYTMS